MTNYSFPDPVTWHCASCRVPRTETHFRCYVHNQPQPVCAQCADEALQHPTTPKKPLRLTVTETLTTWHCACCGRGRTPFHSKCYIDNFPRPYCLRCLEEDTALRAMTHARQQSWFRCFFNWLQRP